MPLGPRPVEPASGTSHRPAAAASQPPTTPRVSLRAIPLPPTVTAIYGLIRQKSRYSVGETTRRLVALIESRGLQVLGDIDFAGDAGRAGLAMRPMRQLVFGDARVSTRLVIAAPTVALDLPMRVLIFEDLHGSVWLAYNDAEYLRERHQLPDSLLAKFGVLPELVAHAVSVAPI
jgi:uncharacterized protein (DUF302 family)